MHKTLRVADLIVDHTRLSDQVWPKTVRKARASFELEHRGASISASDAESLFSYLHGKDALGAQTY